jgi:HEAT repeat protein
VSLALDPLVAGEDLRVRKSGCDAMQKWGTPANVPSLILAVNGGEFGVFDLRISAARALAAIGDERGFAAIASRLESSWDTGRGLIEILVSLGPRAEDAVLPHLSDKQVHTRRAALQVIKQIGTAKSLPALEKLRDDPFLRRDVPTAIAAVKARSGKTG